MLFPIKKTIAVLATLALALLQGATGHGWIISPPARNLMALGQNGFYQPMSLNRWPFDTPLNRIAALRTALHLSFGPSRTPGAS